MQAWHFLRITALTLFGAGCALGGCSPEGATAVEDATGGAPSGFSGSGGSVSSSGGLNGSGGIASAGGVNATGGNIGPSTGGASSGGTSGGSGGSGGGGNGGGGVTGSGGSAPIPDYTLVVDAPADKSSVSGTVTVRGRAPGFLNVEVWDATHQKPPLAQVLPASDGTFSLTVDTTGLPLGPVTWTVWGWDSLPGAAFNHTASVTLNLTLTDGQSQPDGGPTTGGPETVGVGDMAAPAQGPAPIEATKVGGTPFVLVKNWNFGTNGTIKDASSLISEFQFHDQFGTIANGTNYGAVTVAPTSATAISASGLGLPGNMQPVEDPTRPTREWTADTLKAHVRPLSASQSTCAVSAHNAGNGSFTAKWKLPNGGALLGKDLLWETRARMPVALAGYWFAIWTAGNQWNGGAEMDVLESFGTPNIYPPAAAFHVNSVGGQDTINYSSWPTGLNTAGVPSGGRDLSQWHVWTWVYKKDDSFKVYFDGVVVQSGTLHWTLGGGSGGQNIDMDFLFDFGWGHTQISDVNITLPASSFPITYEIDYSRVYLR